jgi:hypothetical protein
MDYLDTFFVDQSTAKSFSNLKPEIVAMLLTLLFLSFDYLDTFFVDQSAAVSF